MYLAAGIVICIYLILFVVSAREDPGREYRGVMGVFCRAALFLYKHACIKKLPLFTDGKVERDLERLHPGQNVKQLCTEYYVKKIALSLMICMAGTMFGAAFSAKERGKLILESSGSITRGSYRDKDSKIVVAASLEENKHIFSVRVGTQRLSEAEAEALCKEFREDLRKSILGDNVSLEEVTGELNLIDGLEGYPFYVEWESSRPDLVSWSGKVEMPEKDAEELVLTAYISYENMEWQEEIPIRVTYPVLSEEEQIHRDLEEMLLFSEEAGRDEEAWKLPLLYDGKEIVWSQIVEDRSLLLWAAVIAAAVLIYFLKDKDLHDDLEAKRKKMKREYSDIAQKMALYLGAGLTVRGAFRKIAGDYEQGRDMGRKQKPIYEEMLYTCRELQAGVSEGAALEHFGKRTGLLEYIRLSTLLQQNLKKGSNTLLARLREEADRSSLERIRRSRKLGEEAVTKLLVPMVMMLAVVMIIIMVPAFSSSMM